MKTRLETREDALAAVPIVLGQMTTPEQAQMLSELLQAMLEVGYERGFADGRQKSQEGSKQ